LSYPKLQINVRKLEQNARYEIEHMANWGVTIMGVNKVFNGDYECASALVRAGMTMVAESRLYNLKKIQDLPCRKCLLRTTALSEVEDAVRYADITLNSDIQVIRALSREAVRQDKVHQIQLMIDMGDLREGIWFQYRDQLDAVVAEILTLPNIRIHSYGTNYNCFGTALPTMENGNLFVKICRELNQKFNIEVPLFANGNSTSVRLMEAGMWPEGANMLRMGGLHEYGLDYVDPYYLPGYYHSDMDSKRLVSNLYILKAEIIECYRKPSVPYGELGLDAFLKPHEFVDRGVRKQAILAIGRQDVPYENIWPIDEKIQMMGQCSDHTIIDIEECQQDYQVGDIISFEIDYTALLAIMNGNSVSREYVDD
jgi:predicted amino acid racemase